MVSGVNLPAAQLQVVMGIPLHRIRQLYGVVQNAIQIFLINDGNPVT